MKIKIKHDPFTDYGESLPHSEDAERAILSCLIQNPDGLMLDAENSLTDEAFYHPTSLLIYRELRAMRSAGRSIDPITLTQWLRDKGIMEKAGGASNVMEIFTDVQSPASYPHYKAIATDKLKSRRVLIASLEIAKSVRSSQHDMSGVEDQVMNQLAMIRSAMGGQEAVRTWDDEVDEWMVNWEAMASGKLESAMPTQWECWNDEIGGIRPGYTIISGESSSGKSTLLSNMMADACIRRGRPGVIFSYEMPVRMVISRIIAEMADIDGKYVFSPDRSKPGRETSRKIADASAQISKSPLRVIHRPSLSAEGACNIARKMFADKGDVIVGVDYIQIIKPPKDTGKDGTREREVAANSEQFRILSKELDRPVIALSQLNKDGSTRESSGINMDCDEHARVDRHRDQKTKQIIDNGIWIYKNRNGRSDFYLPLHLNGPRFRFEEENKTFEE